MTKSFIVVDVDAECLIADDDGNAEFWADQGPAVRSAQDAAKDSPGTRIAVYKLVATAVVPAPDATVTFEDGESDG